MSNASAEQLRLFLDRIRTLEEERAGIGQDIRDVYAEAKDTGFDPPTMKKVIKLTAMDPAQREESTALLDTYLVALGLADEGTEAREDPKARRIEADILATLRAIGRCTIVTLKTRVKDKTAKALGYDQLTARLGAMIDRGEVASGPGRLADFPEYWSA